MYNLYMSEEDIKAQRAFLLFDLDSQKRTVSELRERDIFHREALKIFLDSLDIPSPSPQVHGDFLHIGDRKYTLSMFDPAVVIKHRSELDEAETRLSELTRRAQQLDIRLS